MHQLFNNQVPLIIGTNKNEGLLIKVNHHPLHLIFGQISQNYEFQYCISRTMFQGFFQRDGGEKSKKQTFDSEVLNIYSFDVKSRG